MDTVLEMEVITETQASGVYSERTQGKALWVSLVSLETGDVGRAGGKRSA